MPLGSALLERARGIESEPFVMKMEILSIHTHTKERERKPGVLLARAIYISRDRLTSFRMYTHKAFYFFSLPNYFSV